MKGYDIDGVLSTGKFMPTAEDVILSARGYDSYQRTIEHLKSWGITEYKYIFLAPYKHEWISGKDWIGGAFKAEIINRIGITEFYEDNPMQIDVIKNNCPNCNVIKV